jgi:hypothetical protein
MPQRVPWQELDGDWSFALVWFAVTYRSPEAYLLLRGPSGQNWCFRCIPLGADAPFAPVVSTIAADDQSLQPEAEEQ